MVAGSREDQTPGAGWGHAGSTEGRPRHARVCSRARVTRAPGSSRGSQTPRGQARHGELAAATSRTGQPGGVAPATEPGTQAQSSLREGQVPARAARQVGTQPRGREASSAGPKGAMWLQAPI